MDYKVDISVLDNLAYHVWVVAGYQQGNGYFEVVERVGGHTTGTRWGAKRAARKMIRRYEKLRAERDKDKEYVVKGGL